MYPFLRSFKSVFSTCFLIISLSLLGASAAWSQTNQSATGRQLDLLADQFVDAWLDLHPISATELTNEQQYEDKFVNDLTPEYRAAARKLYSDTRMALTKINAQKMTPAERITRDVFEYRLQIALEELQHDFHLTPINQFDSLPLTLVQMASTEGAQPFATVINYDNFLTRLNGFPGWVDSAIANMREGMNKGIVQPKVLMARVLAQLKTQMVSDPTASGFYMPAKKFPAAFAPSVREGLAAQYREAVEKKLTPAMTRLHDFIANEYLPKCRDSAGIGATSNGATKYAFLARQMTSTKLTPEQIHATGLSEVARIRGEMEHVKKQVGFNGDLNAFLASLATNPQLMPFKTEAEVIEAYRQIEKRVEPTINKLFLTKPRSKLEIRPEPEITKATAAAHYNVGSRDGTRPGVFYAPVPSPTTYATPEMTSLFLHEALPGHHFQLSLSMESEHTRLRRYSYFNAYGEGWALYTEGLGKELGLYDDPYQYLGRLTGEMHRAIRLVVDTGMHVKGWTREKAIAYSLENEGGQEADAVQEIERYMAIPGQALGYKIGELKILELRRKAEKKLGTKFDIRTFHDEILKEGNLPLAVLEAKMDRWLGTQK